VNDSVSLAKNLGVRVETVPIGSIHDAYLEVLGSLFPCSEVDVTIENIQARIRGNILMALSNREGHLLLSTGNKSELAVGYCTLYGDMSGGLAVISDVPKTMVYRLARYLNRNGEVIPESTISKPPSAELRPDQLDQDSLPPYDVLDAILEDYVDEGRSLAEIIAAGADEETARWVVGAVNRNEYKRRQAAPGLKVTSKAFGTGRRMPIAARYEP
jgi:NAD+ synthase (glutamine-hydrolysing)